MSVHFYAEVDQFLACYKREHASAKKDGNTDERETDAISSTLFKLLMMWAIEEGNVFVWCFSLLIWHLMVCNVNVDCLSLHNLKRAISDSIVLSMMKPKWTRQVSLSRIKCLFQSFEGPGTFLCFYCFGLLLIHLF
jgi:hypothetical protein